jgi:hypothetical protein
MWFRFTSIALISFSSLSNAVGQNFLGDTLTQGQQFVSTSISMSDWYAGAEYVDDASVAAIDDLDRGFSDANKKGYDFKTVLTYKYGVTKDITLGFKYGYSYQKDEASIASAEGAGFEGDWITEGGSDLTLLGVYRLDESSSVDVFIDLPICSASAFESACSTKLAASENTTRIGSSGGQGKGYYRVGGAISSNWVTVMDTHWMGSLFTSMALSDEVYGEKVSAPFTYGATFGAIMPIKQNHSWTGSLTHSRMLGYSSYNPQVQDKVSYSDHSSLVIRGEYLWDFMARLQLRPYVDLAMVQEPTIIFTSAGQRRSIEYTSGSKVTLGAELRATF